MNKEQRVAAIAMWADLRADGEMICDAPARKIGMPRAQPYVICFPVEIDGNLVFVDIDVEQAQRFSEGLLAKLPLALQMTKDADAEYLTHEVICKAQGH